MSDVLRAGDIELRFEDERPSATALADPRSQPVRSELIGHVIRGERNSLSVSLVELDPGRLRVSVRPQELLGRRWIRRPGLFIRVEELPEVIALLQRARDMARAQAQQQEVPSR